ncbi:MAG: protein kinase [Verrucomicrobiota bacterium JB023]|nr:protein kinase [Verrucomicrobiota bacterium JB023]
MGQQCRTCEAELPDDGSGYCPRCLFGTALVELTKESLGDAPEWHRMEDYLEDFQFVGELGRGGTGAVYEAIEKKSGQRVAVKVLAPALAENPEFGERFRREARVLAALRHENLVRVRDWGERNHLMFLTMDFVQGGDVAGLLAKEGRLPLGEAVRVLQEACLGMEEAHRQGILHRDLKPGNLLLDKAGSVRVADFGLAKEVGQASSLGLTVTQARMGTPRYMAPEQLEGAEVDERTDVYALGVVFYELLAGRPPGGNFALPSELLGLDERVDEFVLRAMSDHPADRFSSVVEFREALLSIERRTSWRTFLLSGLLVMLVIFSGWWLWAGGESKEQGETWRFTVAEGDLPDNFPARLGGVSKVVLSNADEEFGVALLADGSLRGLGANTYGQASPPGGTHYIDIVVGNGRRAAHALALGRDGQVVAWGDDSYGQVRVPNNLGQATEVAAGEFWSAARVDGAWVVWGRKGDDEEIVARAALRGKRVSAEKVGGESEPPD